jgi:rhamnogalacturonyl hydrolase YesR
MENFGDDTFEWGYGPVYTFWSNQEDDRTHGMLMQYVRSGDLRWWELGEQAARHYRDVDCIAASPGRPADIGGPVHHNSRHFVTDGWVADHTYGSPDTGHSWIEGLIDYWLLTGDPLAGEAVVRMGDWYVRKVDGFQFGAGGQERGQGWTLTALTSIYRVTGDRRYLDAAQRVQDWINDWQDPVRGVISVPISEQPSYEGGTTFMHGIVAHGVARLYEVTGDPATLRSLRGLGEWIVTEPMGPMGQFWYKQAPSCKRGYSYNGKAMTATSYLYEFTGDEQMARVTEEIFNHISPDIRSMPFLTPTTAHMARWRQRFVVPPSGGLETANSATSRLKAERRTDLRPTSASAAE